MTSVQNEPFKKTFTLHGAPVERMVWLDTISEYDEHGRKIRRVFASGIESRIFYDENGRPVRWEFSDGTEEICEYDENGNKIRERDADGYELWWEYEFRADGTLKRLTEYIMIEEQSPQTEKESL